MLKINKYNVKNLFLLRILSILVNIAPLLILLIINWEVYTKTKTSSIALSFTGIVWLCFVIMSAFNTLSVKLARPVKLLCFFLILYLIDPLILSMKWFVLCSFLGSTVDYILIQPYIKKMNELKIATKTTDLTKEALKEMLQEQPGGRV